MPYSSNAELPANVRSSLSEEDQSKWRETFNAALEQYGSEESAFRVAWSVVKKSSDTLRHFGGWISVEKKDSQGDVVEIGALHDAVKKYIARGGPIMDDHTNRQVGALYDAFVADHPSGHRGLYGYGAVFLGERMYDQVWDEVRNGKTPGLSIGGDAIREERVCDAKSCYNLVRKEHIFEISRCKHPANHDALITEINAKAKAEDTKMGEEEEKGGEIPEEDQPQASAIQDLLIKIFAMLSDHVKESKMPETEEPPEKPPEEKKPEAEGEMAEEPQEKKDVSKMEKSETIKEEPKQAEQPIQPTPEAPPITQAPPVQATPPAPPPTPPKPQASPAPIPQPSVTVETPRPGVVEAGAQANDLMNLLSDPVKLKKMSIGDIVKQYRPK